MLKRFDDWLGDRLAFGLSTMAAFYVVSVVVILPLIWQRPVGLVGWIEYIVQSFFQGAALPVLGYVSRKAGEKSEVVLIETHDTVMEELGLIKQELALAKEERDKANSDRRSTKMLVEELHKSYVERSQISMEKQ